jgi:hypothetical protein
MVATETLAALTVVSLVGGGFVLFGYDLADRLVSWVGWVAGAGGGAAAAWLVVPRFVDVTFQGRLAGVGLLALAGAVLGRVFVPLVSRIAVVLGGFVATGGAVLVVLAGGQVTNAVVGVDATAGTQAISRLAELPLFTDSQFQQFLLIAALAGLLGGAAAARYYQVIVTVAATGLGAALLGAAVPLWQRALTGSVQFGGGLGRISRLWFAVALIAGVAIQGYRHRDEIPFLSDETGRSALD